jgi:branched-subunit amino acid aminotransferase/4-amino-4-deoxychorismate lyase
MTREDIINLARQHGKPVQEQNAEVEYLFTLEGVNALLAAEREACATACEEFYSIEWLAQHCAAAIRARGNT